MSADFKRTGIFLDEDELKEVVDLMRKAQNTPVMALSMAHGLEKGGFSGEAWTRFHERVDELAIEHGLPAPGEGNYGLDGSTGEILDIPDD